MSLSKRFCLLLLPLVPVACATAPPAAGKEPESCPIEVGALFDQMVGDWSLQVRADEGWTGYGTSTVAWSPDQKCGLMETSIAVFNQESDTPFENRSTAYLAYDALSETIKVFTGDARGYVHIGKSSAQALLNFEVLTAAGDPAMRQIQYRNIKPDSFEWSWQGRANSSDTWEDRLIITYLRRP